MRRDFQHLATRRFGLRIQVGPQNWRHICSVGSCLGADLDFVSGDVIIQAGQELLGKIVSAINAPVVADELTACHLLRHLQQPYYLNSGRLRFRPGCQVSNQDDYSQWSQKGEGGGEALTSCEPPRG